MMKKALLAREIFNINFNIIGMTDWERNNYKIHISRYLKNLRQPMKFGQLIEHNMKNIFLNKHAKVR